MTPTAAAEAPEAQATSTLTIESESVRLWLQGANENRDAEYHLWNMYFARKRRDTPEAQALLTGSHCARREAEDDIAHLTKAGGLLHLGRARVDYVGGEYRLVGTYS